MGEGVAVPRELGREQCLRLLAGCRYGRVVLTEHALPSMATVALRLDDEGIARRLRARTVKEIHAVPPDDAAVRRAPACRSSAGAGGWW